MATLKISDLSVGDWVRYEDKNYRLYAIEVCGLLGGKWRNGDNIAHIVKNIDYFDPIPITAEMLEANGFERPDKKVYMDTWSWTNKEDTMIEVSMYKDKAYIRVARFEDGILRDRDCNFGLNYIHQLQRALSFANIDKEITL